MGSPVGIGYVLLVLMLLLSAAVLWIQEGFQQAAEQASKQAAEQAGIVVHTSSPLNFYRWFQGAQIRPLPARVEMMQTLYGFLERNGAMPMRLAGPGTPDLRLILLDPLDASRHTSRLPVAAGVPQPPEGYFVMVASPLYGVQPAIGGINPRPADGCAYSWLGKRIGYFDVCEYNLIQAYIQGFRIPSDSIAYEQLRIDQVGRLREVMEERKLDRILLYVIPESPLHRIVRSQEVTVLGWSDVDVARLYAFYPFLQAREVGLRGLFMTQEARNRAIVRTEDSFGTVLAMRMSLRLIPGYEPATPGGLRNQPQVAKNGDGFVEQFVTRLSWPREALDPAYKCYGDQSIAQMALCDSRYDAQGLPKPFPTIWDARCFQDTDCPFWDADRRRGGCRPDSTCEMPVGVRREAYRRYMADGIYAPFCKTDDKAEKDLGYAYPGDAMV